MGIAKQIGLLLKQNLIERRRRWGITLLELGWPVVLLIIIVSMRSFYPITNIKDCKYEPRAMPSSGVFPFVQSYACNLDAKPKCMDGDKATTAKLKERTTALKQVEDVLYENRPLFSALNAGLVQTMPALEQLSVVFTENPEIQEFLNVTDDLLAKNLFKDANLLREELIDTYGLDAELVDTIMNSNINLTKGIELLQGITSELCDVNNTSTPLTDYLILPFNSTSSLADINREICNLGEEQIASLVDLLQEQLDSSAVFSLVKRLMSLFTPNVSDLLSDLEHMVDVVRSLSSFKGLTEQLPSLQKALEFATELLSFARKAAQQLPISPDQISNILEQLDPLITSWSKQSPVWEDIKRAIYYLTTGMDWLANTLDSLPDMKITFGDLYTDRGQTILGLVNSTSQDSQFLIDVLSNSTIDMEKLLDWQNVLTSAGSDGLCAAATAYFKSFNYPDNVDAERLEEAINRTVRWYCQFNPQLLIDELSNNTNFDTLISTLMNGATGNVTLDWKSVVAAGWDLVTVITKLQDYFQQYASLVDELINTDFTKVFSQIQQPFRGYPTATQAQSVIFNSITQMLELVESVLKATPAWPYVRRQLIYQNLFTELVNDAANLSIEATNITYLYFTQNQSERFLFEFVTLDPKFQQDVVRGLSHPSTVRIMLRHPQEFTRILCSNLTGLLSLTVNTTTENRLNQLFCNGEFVMPTGLSDKILAIGIEIEQKVDLLVEAFNDPNSLNSTKYDSLATLAAQLRYNLELGDMIGIAAQELPLSESAALQFAKMNTDWKQYSNVVPYAIMSTIMDTLGEALEDSEGWSTIAPYIASLDYTSKYLLQLINKQEELLSDKRMTGRILDWVLTYGPKKLSLTMEAMKNPEKSALVMGFLTGSNPLDILQLDCNQTLQDWFYGVGTLDNLPMAELRVDVCRPDMAEYMYAELADVYDINNYLITIREMFYSAENTSVDWVDMSKSLTDLPEAFVGAVEHYADLFSKYDWQSWYDFIIEMLQNLSTTDPAILGDTVDRMLANSTEWRITKHALKIFDIMAVQLSDRYRDIAANGLTLSTLFVNATQIREYIVRNNQLSPILVDALFDTLIDPAKLFSEIITGNFTGRVYCQDLFISQFIEFKDAQEAKLVDEAMCGAGNAEILAALQSDPVTAAVNDAVLELTNGLIANNLTDIELNYQSLVVHVTEMVQALMDLQQNFTGPIFPDLVSAYNMTALNFRYQAAFERFMQQDITDWADMLDGLVEQLKNNPDLNSIGKVIQQMWNSIAVSLQQNLYSSQIILQQFRSLTSAAKMNNGYISLKDLVLPGELRNVLAALENSPEMTDTLLFSLIQLMNQPDKIMSIVSDPNVLNLMCTNLSTFEHFFSLPPGANYSSEEMQTSMCSFNINIPLLVQEMVDNIDGFAELVSMYSMYGNSSTFEDGLFAQYFNASSMLQQSIAELLSIGSGNTSLEFVTPRWLREGAWQEVISNINSYSQTALQQITGYDGYMTLLQGVLASVDPYVNSDETTKRALVGSTAILEYMVKVFEIYNASEYNESIVLSGMDELSTVYRIYRQLPDLVESLVITSIVHPEKLNSFVQMLTTPGAEAVNIFCTLTNEDFKDYFVTPAGNKAGFSELVKFICLTPPEDLMADLRRLPAGDSIYFDNIIAAFNMSVEPPPFSGARLLQQSRAFYDTIVDMVTFYNNHRDRASDVLQVDVWMRVVSNIDGELRLLMDQPFNAERLLPLFQSIDINLLLPDLVPYIHTGLAIANVTLRKLEHFNKTRVEILELFSGYPEATKAMRAFNMSLDIVELLLTAGNSVKLQSLVLLPGYLVLPTLCADDWSEYFAVGPSVDLESIKAYVCTTNWSAVYSEIVTDLDIPYIESQLTNNSTVSWTEILQTVDAMNELIADIIAVKPTFEWYPWMNETAWTSMMERAARRVAAQFMDPEYQLQNALAILTQLSPIFEEAIEDNYDIKRILYSVNIYLRESAATIQKLSENGWDLSLLFANTSETSKLLALMDEAPGYVDIALQTSLQPEKIAPLVRQLLKAGDGALAKFCTVPDLTIYVVHDNQTDLAPLKDLICASSVNFSLVLEELMTLNSGSINSFNVSDEFLRGKPIVKELILSVSQLITQIKVLFSDIGSIQANTPYWLQPSVWQHVLSKFSQSLASSPPLDVFRILRLQQMLGVEDLLEDVKLPQLNVANAVLDVLIEKLELLNATEVNISTLVESSPSAVKALNLLKYLPDIVEILMASGQTPQFSNLFALPDAESAVTTLCTSPATYLTVPRGSAASLNDLMQEFCSNNWTAVAKELMVDINLEHILLQMNNTFPVSMSTTLEKIYRLNDLMQYLITNPPTFIVDPSWGWLNASVWEGIFNRLNSQQLQGIVDLVTQYFYQVLTPLLGNSPEFNKFGAVLEKLLNSLKYELDLWNRPGQNLTVADIIAVDSRLGEYIVEALELSPQMYSLLLSVSIRNPGDLQILYSSRDPQALLCDDKSDFLERLTIPPEVNMTAVKGFLCSANFTVLFSELMQRFNIPEIMTIVESNYTTAANWTKIQQDLSDVVAIITEMATNAPSIIPPFDVNEFGKIAQDLMSGIDWADAEVYLQMTESMIRYFSTQPFWSDVEPYLKIAQIVQSWMNDVVSRVNLNYDWSINLADLFPNATLLNEYLQASLSLDDETVIKLVTGVSLKANKFIELFLPAADNNTAIIDLVCNVTQFADMFSVPESIQVTDLSSALCNMLSDYGTGLVTELEKSLQIDSLIQRINSVLSNQSNEVFNIRKSFNLEMELIRKIESLANASQVLYGNVDLKEKFALFTNETTFQSYLLALTQSLPEFELKMVGDVLNGMMPFMRSMDWWREAEKYFKVMNILAEVGANRTAELPVVNLTLSTLLRDAAAAEKLLKDGFAFTPDLVEALLNAELTISPADIMRVNSTSAFQQLICSSKFPAGVNVTAVKIILCDTDFQKVLDELLKEFRFDVVIEEIENLAVYSNITSDFDWNDLLANTNDLARNLGIFFTSLQPPPVTDFFLYDGDIITWLENLSKALASTMSTETAFRRLADALSSLESSLSGRALSDYQQVVLVAQIIQNYLDVAIGELSQYNETVSLDTILGGRMQLINLVNASAAALPEVLELLLTEPMKISQLAAILSDPEANPCTMDLSQLFVESTPEDIVALQNLFCTINFTILFEEIKEEFFYKYYRPQLMALGQDRSNFDWAGYMGRFVELSQLIEQMVKSPPSISPGLLSLVNVTEYMKLFDRVQQYWMSQQFALDPNSFASLMEGLNPLLQSSEFGQQLSKFLNMYDIILSNLNGKLQDIIANNEISLESLLGDSPALRDYLQQVFNISPQTVFTILMSQPTADTLRLIIAGKLNEICLLSAENILITPEGVSIDHDLIKSIFCDANITVFIAELSDETGVPEIIRLLTSNSSMPVEWKNLFNNTQEFATLLAYLATNNTEIDQALMDAFNFSRFAPVWESLQQFDPRSLLRLLDAYGPLLKDAAGESWPIFQTIIYQYSMIMGSSERVLADLVSSGFTFESLMNNRTALIELFSKMTDMSFDATEELYVDMYKDTMTALLQRQEIQDLLCNETSVRTLLPNLPDYVDLTSLFCGVRDDSWLVELRARNYSILEIFQLDMAIQMWYLDQVMMGKYDWEYIYSYRRFNSMSINTTLGDLATPIRELIDVLGSMGSLPPQFFPGFNISYWMPLIEALGQGYVNNMPELVLKMLDLLDPLLRDTEFWQQMKTAVGAASQYMGWINDKLEMLDKQGTTIEITQLFPDADEVRALLEAAMTPDAVSEFLTIHFNPLQMLNILQADPSTLFCDAEKFNESISFPAGVDVVTIQQNLCAVASNNSLILSRVWELFDMKELMNVLARLTGSNQPLPPLTESPFRSALKQVQRLLQNAHVITRLMQAFSKGMPDVSPYVNMMLTTVDSILDPDANNIGGMCDALIDLVDETPSFGLAEPHLVQVQVMYSIVDKMIMSIDEFDDFLYDLPSMNMSTLIARIANPALVGDFLLIGDPEYLSTTRFDCSSMIHDAITSNLRVQNMVRDLINGSYEDAFKNLVTSNFTLANDVNIYMELLDGLRNLLNADSLTALRPLLEGILDNLLGQVQASRIGSLFNTTAFEEQISDVFERNASLVSAEDFLNTFVDVEQILELLNLPLPDVEQVVCNPKSLEKLTFTESRRASKLAMTLCADSEALEALWSKMASNLNAERLQQLAASKDMQDFFTLMAKHLNTLIGQLRKYLDIPNLMDILGNPDLSALAQLLPEITEFMNSGNNLDSIIDSLIGILDLLETRLPAVVSGQEVGNILDDVKLLLNGIRALKTVRDALKINIPMASLLNDPSQVEDFLRSNTNLTEVEISDFMDSYFTWSLMTSQTLSVQKLREDLCDETYLRSLLVLPTDSKLSYMDISSALCSLYPDLATSIALELIKNLQVSDMLAKIVSDKFGVDTAELKEAAEILVPLQEELSVTMAQLSDATATLYSDFAFIQPTDSAGSASSAAAQSMSLSTMLCGGEVSGYNEEQNAISQLDFAESESPEYPADLEESFNPTNTSYPAGRETTQEEYAQLHKMFYGANGRNAHCDEIRRAVYKETGGKIMWEFMKPLFVGKILYTPDNDLTKEIVRGSNVTFQKFSTMLETIQLVIDTQESFLNAFNNPEKLEKFKIKMDPQESLEILKGVSPDLIRSMLKTDLDMASLARQLELFTSDQNQAMLSLMSSGMVYADCISLDRFQGVSSEAELEELAKDLHKSGEFIAGLVFENTNVQSSSRKKRETTPSMPKHLKYKIRMDIENVETTLLLQELFYSAAPRDNTLEDMRYLRGFLQIQEMVDRSITNIHLKGNDTSISKTSTLVQLMPATCYNEDIFMGFVYPYLVPIVMTLSWLFAVAHCIKTLTAYRETGLEELMKIMGLKGGVIWSSWFINTFFGMTILSGIATLFLMFGQIFILSNGLIVFLYLLVFSLSSTMFCYMIGSFFSKANVAAAIGVMVYCLSYMPYIIYSNYREYFRAPHFHASCLMSTTAFAIGATYMSRLEQMGEGVQWSNIDKAPGYNEDWELSVQWMFIWMLIDSFIYLLIGWYIRNIKPGKFGQRLPLYFPFTKSYWNIGSARRASRNGKQKASEHDWGTNSYQSVSLSTMSSKKKSDWLTGTPQSDSRLYKTAKWQESSGKYLTDLPVGISVEKLRKVYSNGKVAVDGLDMVFHEGHVTAFLGRNGAGKTTTINMLTGMTAPTAGSAVINGWTLDGNSISNIRKNLGYCPQFDMLFDFMTVKEHLHMFASLKSSEPASVLSFDVEEMLHNIGLWSVRNELVGTLSGGMQRRLSVAIAFIGNSKVIILDEPTSSIDPNGRRAIWDLILKNRTGKTIILCTHHLDEADTLGDRVAIVDKGKLRAEGSPMSLKKEHASGYQLFLEKMPSSQPGEFNITKVTDLIKKYCPTATLMSDIGSSLTYSLPSDELPSFEKLFKELDGKLSDLGISGFGISDSTLDEVFENITEEEQTQAASEKGHKGHAEKDFGTSSPMGCGRLFSALLRKRFIHTLKDFKTYFALILLPCAFIALALGVTLIIPDRSNQPSLELQPSLYPNSYSFYSSYNVPDGSAMASTLLSDAGIGTSCLRDANPRKSTCDGNTLLQTASDSLEPLPVCQCSIKSHYDCEGDNPQQNTYLTSDKEKLLHVNESYDMQDYLLSTYNFYKASRYGGWTFRKDESNRTEATVWFDNRAFHSLPSYMNALSNMMVRAGLDRMGMQGEDYGITVYSHPLSLSPGQLSVKNALEKTADLGISITFLVAFSFIPAALCMYLVLERVKGEKHLQYVYGVGPIRYWLVTYLWDMLMFAIPIGLCLLLMYAFGISTYTAGDNLLVVFLLLVAYAWAVLPFMYMMVKLFKSTTTAFFSLLMANMFLGIALSTVVFLLNFFQLNNDGANAYIVLRRVFLIFPQYSFTAALIQININQALIDLLQRFDEELSSTYHPFNEQNGIVWHLISLAIQGAVFFLITLLTEIQTSCNERISKKKKNVELDSDVEKEKTRVHNSPSEDVLLVRGLSKQYRLHNLRHVLAVNDLSFGVKPGEIFGLCGVNGAGKTTAFRMLTGEVLPTEGAASLHKRRLVSSKSRRLIGYCPQINSLDAFLTGRQTLHVYAQLKGIDNADQAIHNIIESFRMKNYADKQVKSLSGGMKRNLCVSIALLGSPDLVLLDEPSAGMDPVARRSVWDQILAAAARGSAVVLTSHSMTECEALCHRIAIMLNGQLACLGSSQHLKNKFGVGYTMKVKVAGPPPNVTKLIRYVTSKWPGAKIKDQHLSTVEFSIPSSGAQTLASIFSLIERERGNLYIEEYSVFQTTLDQVFIQFARNQQDQIDEGSEDDLTSSTDSESTSHYDNKAYAIGEQDIKLEVEEPAIQTLKNLDGEQTWSTYL